MTSKSVKHGVSAWVTSVLACAFAVGCGGGSGGGPTPATGTASTPSSTPTNSGGGRDQFNANFADCPVSEGIFHDGGVDSSVYKCLVGKYSGKRKGGGSDTCSLNMAPDGLISFSFSSSRKEMSIEAAEMSTYYSNDQGVLDFDASGEDAQGHTVLVKLVLQPEADAAQKNMPVLWAQLSGGEGVGGGICAIETIDS